MRMSNVRPKNLEPLAVFSSYLPLEHALLSLSELSRLL